MARFTDDTGIVSACRKHKRNIRIGQMVEFKHRPPRCDMIFFRSDCENRNENVRQEDRPTANFIAAADEIIIQIKMAEILRMHAIRQSGRVGVPCH